MGTIQSPINSSKGCGGVMRVAPVGLVFQGRKAFQIACQCAAITHGHPSGYISSGIFAYIIAEIIQGKEIRAFVNGAYRGMQKIPKRWTGKLELLEVLTEMADDIYEFKIETAIF